jgi:hypothetical protein
MFVGKARACPRVEHLERLARDKHSSLLQKYVNYDRKRFYSTSPARVKISTFSTYLTTAPVS